MTSGNRRVALALLLACLTRTAEGQEKVTERTLKLAPGAKSPQATLADMAWLAGHWVGPSLGGEAEEIWSPPKAGSMMGMYRLVRDGKPIFYEFQTLVEEGGSLVLRLKHFNPDLTGWEEKQKIIDFRLVGVGERIVQFEGMSFYLEGDAKGRFRASHSSPIFDVRQPTQSGSFIRFSRSRKRGSSRTRSKTGNPR